MTNSLGLTFLRLFVGCSLLSRTSTVTRRDTSCSCPYWKTAPLSNSSSFLPPYYRFGPCWRLPSSGESTAFFHVVVIIIVFVVVAVLVAGSIVVGVVVIVFAVLVFVVAVILAKLSLLLPLLWLFLSLLLLVLLLLLARICCICCSCLCCRRYPC